MLRHQHLPSYWGPSSSAERTHFLLPWIRLHAIRDYHSMAALVAEHPGIHLTINLTPVLLNQIQEYVERGATDRALGLDPQAGGGSRSGG